MADNKIVLCMGSSCFTRGNNRNVDIIKKYVEDRDIQAEIEGSLCEDDCMNGPHVRINGEKVSGVTEENILQILREKL